MLSQLRPHDQFSSSVVDKPPDSSYYFDKF